jgi:signal transduction histidine kinase/ligand-binding sensor domain-containing protein
VTAVVEANGLATSRDIKSLCEDREGALWIGAPNGVLMRFKDGRVTSYSPRDDLPDDRINCIREDRKGSLWLGLAKSGLVRFKDGRFTRYTTADGLTGDHALSIFEDREGVLWIGTASGLNRLRDNIITSYSTEQGLAAGNIYPICEDREGAVWIGSWTGLTRYKDGAFASLGHQYGVAGEMVTALMVDSEGSLWIGTLGGGVRRSRNGKIISYRAKDGLPSDVVRAIYQDRRGDVWFGTSQGLGRYEDGSFSVYTTKDGLPADAISVLFEDSRGNLWIGTQRGLCRYRDGRFDSYREEKSLSDHIVRAIYEDSEGVLWIGTYDNGLTRIEGERATSITTREGLTNNGVFQILEDARGNFWISCNLGIYRVSRKELNDYALGRARAVASIPYGKRDGMLNSECNGGSQPAGIRARDGRLWFPTQGGVAVVDPEAVPVSAQPPPVVIEEFLLENNPVAHREAVEIEPGIENFEIHYTGLSFVMSERIKFRFKLEGWDTDWVEAGTRRVAYYSHVRPGDYSFRVIAANRDGVWNMEGAAVRIRIIPPFWRTWWFLSLALATLAGLVLLGFRLRIARLERARRAQEAFSEQLISSQESERKRIAAELHDSLGQHLLIIKNSALLALNSSDGKDHLGDISATASQAIDEVREISYNLRPYQLDDLGLTRAIEAIIAKVASSSEIEFTWELDRIDGLFSAEAEINIYRIIQESLNNIVRHSSAHRSSIRTYRHGRRVEIVIRDDGRGFNAQESASAGRVGFGLKGISERARMLGAKCVINSAVGQGTTINLNLEAGDGRREK